MIRPLGHNERYQLARYTLNLKRGTSVTCRYTIPESLTGEISCTRLVDTVKSAIGRIISAEPILQVGISCTNSAKPVCIERGTVDLGKHIEWASLASENSMQEVIESQLDMKFFDLNARPGWRVVVIQHSEKDVSDILLVCNYPHADREGGRAGRQDLDELILRVPDSSSRFPPTTEEVAGLPVTRLFVLKEFWNDYKPPSLFPKSSLAEWAPIRTQPYKTRFQVFSIPNSVVTRIVAVCHNHKTTLTGLFNGLLLVSLALYLEKKDATAFASSTAIEQRRFIPSRPPAYPWLEPNKTIANYVTVVTHEYDRALVADIRSKLSIQPLDGHLSEDLLDLLWRTAAHVRNEIEERLKLGLQNDMVGLAKFVPDFRKQFYRDVKKPRKHSWFLTNIGIIDGGPAESAIHASDLARWSICRAQLTVSTEPPMGALLVAVASVKNQELVVTCTWQDTVVQPHLVEAVMADMERWLTQIGSS